MFWQGILLQAFLLHEHLKYLTMRLAFLKSKINILKVKYSIHANFKENPWRCHCFCEYHGWHSKPCITIDIVSQFPNIWTKWIQHILLYCYTSEVALFPYNFCFPYILHYIRQESGYVHFQRMLFKFKTASLEGVGAVVHWCIQLRKKKNANISIVFIII